MKLRLLVFCPGQPSRISMDGTVVIETGPLTTLRTLTAAGASSKKYIFYEAIREFLGKQLGSRL